MLYDNIFILLFGIGCGFLGFMLGIIVLGVKNIKVKPIEVNQVKPIPKPRGGRRASDMDSLDDKVRQCQ